MKIPYTATSIYDLDSTLEWMNDDEEVEEEELRDPDIDAIEEARAGL